MAKPLSDWLRTRDPDGALEAWRVAITIPRRLVFVNGWKPFAIISLPSSIFYTLELGLPAYSALIIIAGSCIAIAYAGVLHFFASELFLRPVVEDIAERLPPDFEGQPAGVPLRWKLLGALPIISVVTGVVTSGLSSGGDALPGQLGLDVGHRARHRLHRVARDDAPDHQVDSGADQRSARAPPGACGPATWRSASRSCPGTRWARSPGSFNEMMRGLSEREALRQAFGSYVDPGRRRARARRGRAARGPGRARSR